MCFGASAVVGLKCALHCKILSVQNLFPPRPHGKDEPKSLSNASIFFNKKKWHGVLMYLLGREAAGIGTEPYLFCFFFFGFFMAEREAQHTWGLLCQSLEQRLQERTFRDWVSPCDPTAFDGSTLWIQAPSASAKLWIEQQLAEDFHDALVQIGLPDLRLVFTAGSASLLEKISEKPIAAAPKGTLPNGAMNFPQGFESYTLENFIVGPNCELAFSAAVGMVKNFGRQNLSFNMNPLFIYGGSGLGKTHLMVGIGKGLMPHHPHLQIAYFKAETF
jgi:chromosomal replication initiator protein